ncbi:MAG: IS91 family transposase [Betaproteobacteria bacterium]|nr:IS91 family transposase [Betaproteobacteria bacterium]
MDCAPINSPRGGVYRPRKPRASPLYQCADGHIGDLRAEGLLRRLVEEKVISRFLKCGDPHHGFARVYCPQCRHDYLLAFSCKARYFCPSCHQKRVLAYGDWVEANILAPVPHRQYVFTVPRILRSIFARRRRLLGALCQIVEKLLREAYGAAKPGGREGVILFVQTFGDLVTFNPHIHVLALLLREGEISEALVKRITTWRHTGFSVHNGVRVRDAAGRQRLAQYMLRAPFSLEKMKYDERTGMVLYRSHLHKSLKRNYQLMPGAQWLELLCRHIPDRFEHLVRYVGWYSCRYRGERARLGAATPVADGATPNDPSADAVRARSAWARLIYKVYEVDPLECPKCKGPMQVIALIDDPAVVRRILKHLHQWSPAKRFIPARGPPYVALESSQGEPLNEQTYHSVPDIA